MAFRCRAAAQPIVAMVIMLKALQAFAGDPRMGPPACYLPRGMPGWWVLQNPWNAGRLVNGVDYTQSIQVDPAKFPGGTIIRWRWPGRATPNNVWGYPEVIYGAQAGIRQAADGKGPRPIQIGKLTTLTGSYEIAISGSTDQFDVLWETQLTSAPSRGQAVEFAIVLHAPSYLVSWFNGLSRKYGYDGAGLSARVAVTNNGSYPFVLVLPDQPDVMAGTVDIKSILDFLMSKNVLSGNEYINGFELGAEPRSGSGTLAISSISYDWNGTVVGRKRRSVLPRQRSP